MKDGTLIQALRLLAAALALRVALVVAGLGQYLVYRVETSTPANSLLTIREGVALLGLGIAPYSGSACHVPPLLLWLLAPTAPHMYLYALPNIVCDIMGALLLRQTARQVMQHFNGGSTGLYQGAATCSFHSPWLTPNTVMALYLFNPFTVASCICGSTSPVENLAVLASLWRATAGDAPGAAFGVALATYLSLHPIILLVPIALLTAQGPEDCTGAGQQQQQHQQVALQGRMVPSNSSEGQEDNQTRVDPGESLKQVKGATRARTDGKSMCRGGEEVGCGMLGEARRGNKGGMPWGALMQFGCMVAFWGLCLTAVSDIAVRHFEGQQCLLPRLLPAQGLQLGLGQPYLNEAHLSHSGVPHNIGSSSSSSDSSSGGMRDRVNSS
ncbi:GPI transamidase subunit PIG-U-domain-containing protein, partial [Dunaliella salina]